MNKKGQAAMEFLMTYGWAILVVLAAIAALAYFGVLSPGNLVPERTTFQAPIASLDSAELDASDGTVEIAMRNNVGVPINLTGTATGDCTAADVTATIGEEEVTHIQNGQTFLLTWTCADAAEGSRADLELGFEYENTETTQTRTHTGTVSGTW